MSEKTTGLVVTVDFKEYGIEESKATEMTSGLQTVLAEREELKKSYIDVIKLEITEENLSTFKELRLKIRDNRTKGINTWHEVNKNFYLRGGQFVDAIKRKENLVNEQMEDKLQEAEKFFENKEKERIKKLQELRVLLISEYVDDTIGLDLGNMQDDVFEAYLGAKKQAKLDRLESERIAEEYRIKEVEAEKERQRLEVIENERVRQENEAFRKEAEAKELAIKKEREENERKAKEEKSKQDAILEKEREAQAKVLADEKAKSDKLQADLKAKQDAEAKVESDRLAKIYADKKESEKLAKAPIKTQLTSWIDTFQAEIPEQFRNDILANDILSKFWSFKAWAKSEIEKL